MAVSLPFREGVCRGEMLASQQSSLIQPPCSAYSLAPRYILNAKPQSALRRSSTDPTRSRSDSPRCSAEVWRPPRYSEAAILIDKTDPVAVDPHENVSAQLRKGLKSTRDTRISGSMSSRSAMKILLVFKVLWFVRIATSSGSPSHARAAPLSCEAHDGFIAATSLPRLSPYSSCVQL